MEFICQQAHVQEFLADVLEPRLRFQVSALVFNELSLGHDVLGSQFLRSPEAVLGDIGLRFTHEVFFNQLIELQAADGYKRLTWLNPIAKLNVNLVYLPFNPGRNLGHLLQIKRDFAWGCHHIWNHLCGDRGDPYSISHGRRGLNDAGVRTA
jgi:hypothetical protein